MGNPALGSWLSAIALICSYLLLLARQNLCKCIQSNHIAIFVAVMPDSIDGGQISESVCLGSNPSPATTLKSLESIDL